MLGKLYRCWSVLRAVGPHLWDRCLHGLQSLVEGQLQRLCLSVVLEEHQRLQQAVHLLCRKTGVRQSSVSGHAEEPVGLLPLILSTVVTSSLRACIRALSSIGLPSFRLSFFRSALRRFFDDLLQGEDGRQPSRERLLNGLEIVAQASLRGNAGVAVGVLGACQHAAGFRVKFSIRTVQTIFILRKTQSSLICFCCDIHHLTYL